MLILLKTTYLHNYRFSLFPAYFRERNWNVDYRAGENPNRKIDFERLTACWDRKF